jgi:hypothetical protein
MNNYGRGKVVIQESYGEGALGLCGSAAWTTALGGEERVERLIVVG